MSRLDLPANPEHVEEAADVLAAHLRDTEPDDARAAAQFRTLARRWAQQVTERDEQAESVYHQALTAAGLADDSEAEPEPEQTEPESPPEPEPEPPEPRAGRVRERPPDPAPPDPALARRLAALAEAAEAAEVRALSPTPRWDPAEQGLVAGAVECVTWADLRQRGGPVRVLRLRQADGAEIEVWAGWQQLAALLGEAEAQHRRGLAPGDLVAVNASHGKQRVGKSRSPSRLFTLAVEWAGE